MSLYCKGMGCPNKTCRRYTEAQRFIQKNGDGHIDGVWWIDEKECMNNNYEDLVQ